MKKLIILILACFFFQSIVFADNVTLKIDTVSAQSGTTVSLAVRGWNFTNMLSMQGTISFDQSIITYNTVEQFGLSGIGSGNFGITQIANGKITFSWNDATLAGVSVADSAVLFAIVFDVIGINGQQSPVEFENSPTELEFVDINFNTITTDLFAGFVHVSSSGGALISLATATPVSLCEGDNTQLNAYADGGSTSYTYSWSSVPSGFTATSSSVTVTPDETTIYTVVVDDGLTNVSSSISVTLNPYPVASFTTINNDPTVDFTNTSTNASTYDWDFGDGSPHDNQSVVSHTYSNTGDFSVTLCVTSSEACQHCITNTITILTIGIADNLQDENLKIYPNPTKSEITVNGYNPAYLKLVNTLGQVVAEANKSNQLYIGNLSQGLYVLQLFDEKGGLVKTEKLVKE